MPDLDAESCIGQRANSLLPNRLIVAMLSALIVSGCAATHRYEASRPEEINKTGAMLSTAGFKTIEIDTSEQVGLAKHLPLHELRSYHAQSGTVYWYYDPNICSCVYEGHQDEFDRYEMVVRQRNDIAQYAAESKDEEVAALYSLNPTIFPPPIFWVGGDAGARGGGHGGSHGGMHGGGHGGGGHGK
jgi:hypothetical protein